MDNNTLSRHRLVDFRLQVYVSFTFRADALFELVDALLLSPILRSAVEVSQSPLFRRCFASVDDVLTHGKIDPTTLRSALVATEPSDAVAVAGHAIYMSDTTIAPRPDAATVPDRAKVYSATQERAIPAHQYSWLGRVLARGLSWFAPCDIVRMATSRTRRRLAQPRSNGSPPGRSFRARWRHRLLRSTCGKSARSRARPATKAARAAPGGQNPPEARKSRGLSLADRRTAPFLPCNHY